MTPAEFDTKRRMLGLSIEEAATLCGSVSPRTINFWIRGERQIPEDAIVALNHLDYQLDFAIEKAVELATDKTLSGVVELIRYRTKEAFEKSPHASKGGLPFGAHAILIGLTAEALNAEGIETEIVWGD